MSALTTTVAHAADADGGSGVAVVVSPASSGASTSLLSSTDWVVALDESATLERAVSTFATFPTFKHLAGWCQPENGMDAVYFVPKSKPTTTTTTTALQTWRTETVLLPRKVVAAVSFAPTTVGAPPNIVHGGAIASVMDSVMGMASMVSGNGGPTLSLTLEFKRPLPMTAKGVVCKCTASQSQS